MRPQVRGRLERWVESFVASEGVGEENHAGESFARRLAAVAEDMAAAGATAPLDRILRGMGDVWVPSAEESGRELFNLATQPLLLRVLARILGPELSFQRGLCRPKLPDLPHSAFPLHQDSQYFDTNSPQSVDGRVDPGFEPSTADMDIVSIWVPLVDTTADAAGGLKVIPQSQRWPAGRAAR